jgi:rsbT co-antagonist protein RsbR
MSEETTSLPLERLRRVMQALSYATADALDEATSALGSPVDDPFGELEIMLQLFFQELKDAQELRAVEEQQRAIIERQRRAIRDLSTPVIDLWESILTLPVVGVVDAQRARDMTEALLQRIIETRAEYVIIDVTGVGVVDTMTADHFIQMVRSARLLGASCVVTGIGPEVAMTLIQSGTELRGVRVVGSLKEGLKECFRRLREGREAHGLSGSRAAGARPRALRMTR